MNAKTILYIDTENDIGGAEVSLIELLRKLDRQKYRRLVALPRKGRLSKELKTMGVPVHFIKMSEFTRRNTPQKYILDTLFFIPCVLELLLLIKKYEVSLIHTNNVRAHFYGSMAGVLARIPVVWHIRDIYRDESTFIRMVSKPFYPLARKVMAISNAVAKAFIEESGLSGKVKVVYNGVDLAKFNPGVIDTSKIRGEFSLDGIFPLIGLVGVLGRWKGQEEFLQAASRLVKVFPKAKFLIVGDSLIDDRGYKERLKGMVNTLGITSHVIFTGFREDIPEILGCLDLLVLPSHNEPFGRVLVEAMAMKKAVVGTDSGGIPEIVVDGKTGLLVPPNNANLLASGMAKILKDRDKLKKMGRLGRKRAETLFTVENYVKGVIKIYTEIFK